MLSITPDRPEPLPVELVQFHGENESVETTALTPALSPGRGRIAVSQPANWMAWKKARDEGRRSAHDFVIFQ